MAKPDAYGDSDKKQTSFLMFSFQLVFFFLKIKKKKKKTFTALIGIVLLFEMEVFFNLTEFKVCDDAMISIHNFYNYHVRTVVVTQL